MYHTVEPEIEEPSQEENDRAFDDLEYNITPVEDGVISELFKKNWIH